MINRRRSMFNLFPFKIVGLATLACRATIGMVLLVSLASFGPATSHAQDSDRLPGTLVICGGGRLPERIMSQFIQLAGGKDAVLVVIPTAGSDEGIDEEATAARWIESGIKNVSVLHTRDREQADDPAFVRPLQEATAVWISGGQQSRLADSYANTLVEDELLNVLKRGGVIGGSSAGAAIMSHVMIAGGRSEPSIKEGLPLLEHAIVDQHFLRRSRVERLCAAVEQHPDCIGLGIDEGTAVIVKDRIGTVVGDSYVVTIDAQKDAAPTIRVYHDRQQVEFRPSNVQNR